MLRRSLEDELLKSWRLFIHLKQGSSRLIRRERYKVRLASQKIWGRITSTFADKTREFRRKTIRMSFFISLKSYQSCSNATEQQWLPLGFMARNSFSDLGILIRTVPWNIS